MGGHRIEYDEIPAVEEKLDMALVERGLIDQFPPTPAQGHALMWLQLPPRPTPRDAQAAIVGVGINQGKMEHDRDSRVRGGFLVPILQWPFFARELKHQSFAAKRQVHLLEVLKYLLANIAQRPGGRQRLPNVSDCGAIGRRQRIE